MLERMLKIDVIEKQSDERDILQGLSKEEIIERYLQAKVSSFQSLYGSGKPADAGLLDNRTAINPFTVGMRLATAKAPMLTRTSKRARKSRTAGIQAAISHEMRMMLAGAREATLGRPITQTGTIMVTTTPQKPRLRIPADAVGGTTGATMLLESRKLPEERTKTPEPWMPAVGNAGSGFSPSSSLLSA
jgi:hypothetical protein